MVLTAVWHKPDFAGLAGLEPNVRARRCIKPQIADKFPIKCQFKVCFTKVMVAPTCTGRWPIFANIKVMDVRPAFSRISPSARANFGTNIISPSKVALTNGALIANGEGLMAWLWPNATAPLPTVWEIFASLKQIEIAGDIGALCQIIGT